MITKRAQESPPVLERKLVPQRDPVSAAQKASFVRTPQRWKWQPGKSKGRKLAESRFISRISHRTFLLATITLCHFSNSWMLSQMTQVLVTTKREKLEMIEKVDKLSLCRWILRLCYSKLLSQSSTNRSTRNTRICLQTLHKKGISIIHSFPQSKSPFVFWRLNLTGKTSKK